MKADIVIGIVMNNSKVLIVKRKENEDKLSWQFPGGSIECNESETQAVIREVLEETGCEVDVKQSLGERLHPDTNRIVSYWACEYIRGILKISDNDLEDVRWVEKKDLFKFFTTSIYKPVIEYLELY